MTFLSSPDLFLIMYVYIFRTNACKIAVCQRNEICHDHWLYYTCQCQSPFFGEKCDQSTFNNRKCIIFYSIKI